MADDREEVTAMRRDRTDRGAHRGGRGAALTALAALLAVPTLSALAACNSTGPDDPAGPPEDTRLVLEGRLTDEGVECPAFRSDDDTLYTLTGDLEGFGPGDRVRIVARPVEMSFCMQGTTVEVLEISALE